MKEVIGVSFTEGKRIYYFDPANNDYMSTKKFLEDENNSTYYFGENGQMYQDQFYSNWGHTYYFQKDGSRVDDGFYTIWGKTSLMDTNWTEVQDGHEAEYNFFKVSVEMP